MLRSAEIVLLVAKGRVAQENFLTDYTCKKANKLTVRTSKMYKDTIQQAGFCLK